MRRHLREQVEYSDVEGTLLDLTHQLKTNLCPDYSGNENNMQLMQRVQELEEIEQMLRNQGRLIKLWRAWLSKFNH